MILYYKIQSDLSDFIIKLISDHINFQHVKRYN